MLIYSGWNYQVENSTDTDPCSYLMHIGLVVCSHQPDACYLGAYISALLLSLDTTISDSCQCTCGLGTEEVETEIMKLISTHVS